MYGELRAQAARHEAITRDALARLEESEARERKHLRELENTRQRVAELEDTVTQLRERSAMTRSAPPSRLSTPRVPKPATTRRKAAEPGDPQSTRYNPRRSIRRRHNTDHLLAGDTLPVRTCQIDLGGEMIG